MGQYGTAAMNLLKKYKPQEYRELVADKELEQFVTDIDEDYGTQEQETFNEMVNTLDKNDPQFLEKQGMLRSSAREMTMADLTGMIKLP